MGNTLWITSSLLLLRDHPHLRGEYSDGVEEKHENMGSPPLAWGILREVLRDITLNGITPTCVGNTLKARIIMLLFGDHPHLRGEYLNFLL